MLLDATNRNADLRARRHDDRSLDRARLFAAADDEVRRKEDGARALVLREEARDRSGLFDREIDRASELRRRGSDIEPDDAPVAERLLSDDAKGDSERFERGSERTCGCGHRFSSVGDTRKTPHVGCD